MSTPTTQPLQMDRDGRPVSQYWNPRTLAYEAAHGDSGALLTTGNIQAICTDFADTAAALGANEIFNGTSRDFTVTRRVASFRASSTADQAGTLFIEQSNNGTDWVMTHSQVTASVPDADAVARHIATIDAPVTNRFVRVRYRNGATLQGAFRLISSQIGI